MIAECLGTHLEVAVASSRGANADIGNMDRFWRVARMSYKHHRFRVLSWFVISASQRGWIFPYVISG